ncbi:winged helix-turn-helix domain-containing protein [Streptomyces syringium]|uniref:winged helix-turn-helix domain-containing protein n=1 Tax=Streptomyces syringium TaxID=76729 RepID=UPI0034543199
MKRVELMVGRLFHVGYTLQGVWRLLKRHGWSCHARRPRRGPHDRGRPALSSTAEPCAWPDRSTRRGSPECVSLFSGSSRE